MMKPIHALAALGAAVFVLRPAAASAAAIKLSAGGDLQAAINAAQPGDTIFLQAGATFVGNFTLPAKAGTDWITIRSDASDAALPASGARITPAFGPLLARIQSPSADAALATAPFAHHYRLQFLEFAANYQGYGDILQLGDGSAAQKSTAAVPHDLVIDRVYIHGDATYGQKRGISLNSAATTITGSYIGDCKAVGQDSQAIAGWNGPGPYTISNNYLEAAGENILFGGADPSIPNLVPSDITIVNNSISKPAAWRAQSWQVKNLLEIKNAQRIVIDGNVLEYNWQAAQVGYSILFTPRNQDGTAPWSVVQQVQFTNNVVRHVASAISILGTDDEHPSQETNGITIRNNLFTDVSSGSWGGPGQFVLLMGGQSITIDHNTVINDGSSALYADSRPTIGLTFTNNIMPDNAYAIMGSDQSPGNGTIAAFFPGGRIAGNVIAGAPASTYPASNYYPSSLAPVGFANPSAGDYSLAAASPFVTAGTDGRPVGCDFGALTRALALAGAGANTSGNGTAPAPSDPSNTSLPVTSPRMQNSHVVWRRDSDGALVVSTLNSMSVVSSAVFPMSGVDPAWKVVGIADFDGDGLDDLLFQNDVTGDVGVWFMTSTGLGAATVIQPSGVAGSDWKVVGVGDFNGDSHPDMLFRNQQTGALGLWALNGVQTVSIGLLATDSTPDPSWEVAGVADFNGDGAPDVLWRNANSGSLGVWLMQGTAPVSVQMLDSAQADGADWQIVAVSDLNGDGDPDIVWQHQQTGLIRVWLMNGVVVESAPTAAPPDASWRIRAAR